CRLHSLVIRTVSRTTPPTPFPYTTLFRSRRFPTTRRPNQSHRLSFFNLQIDLMQYLCFGIGEADPIKNNLIMESGNIARIRPVRSEEHTSELQSRENLVCRLLLEKKK